MTTKTQSDYNQTYRQNLKYQGIIRKDVPFPKKYEKILSNIVTYFKDGHLMKTLDEEKLEVWEKPQAIDKLIESYLEHKKMME